MFDVITIGAATRDVFLVSKAFMLVPLPEIGGGLAECVALGSKIDVDELVLTTGGGATNAAATLANLGFRTACIAKIGDDEPGRAVVDDLTARRIDTSRMKRVKGGKTGYSTLLTAVNGERTVLVFRGVSAEWKESDVRLKTMQARWLYMTSIGGNLPLLLSIVRQAKVQETKVAFNPGSAEIALGLESLDPILRQVTFLLLNLEEAQRLANLQTTDPKELAGRLLRPGMTLVVTDGPLGATAFCENTTWKVGTRNVRSVSRTGAGDAFGSGIVAGLMKDLPLEVALKVGALNAETVIGQVGAKHGILKSWPTAKQLGMISVISL